MEHDTVGAEPDANKVDPLRADLMGQSPYPRSLGVSDSVDRVIASGHGPHLYGDSYPSVEGEKIDLAICHSHVSGNYLKPVVFENVSCDGLPNATHNRTVV